MKSSNCTGGEVIILSSALNDSVDEDQDYQDQENYTGA